MERGDEDLKRTEGSAMEGRGGLKMIARAAGSEGPGKRMKKKLVRRRLNQGLIEEIMKNPLDPVQFIPEERLAKMSERSRANHARCHAIYKEITEFDADIIKQYNTKGYAEMEEEVDDDVEVKNY